MSFPVARAAAERAARRVAINLAKPRGAILLEMAPRAARASCRWNDSIAVSNLNESASGTDTRQTWLVATSVAFRKQQGARPRTVMPNVARRLPCRTYNAQCYRYDPRNTAENAMDRPPRVYCAWVTQPRHSPKTGYERQGSVRSRVAIHALSYGAREFERTSLIIEFAQTEPGGGCHDAWLMDDKSIVGAARSGNAVVLSIGYAGM